MKILAISEIIIKEKDFKYIYYCDLCTFLHLRLSRSPDLHLLVRVGTISELKKSLDCIAVCILSLTQYFVKGLLK